ncbi:MAG: hypothetical protein A2Y64_09110 [Candidatus Coatesbacteria bacterium RBG_13_66_14]|uniref:Cytosolic protein n=1 Tax=Candidatus Coatesbacteria bacterium RBG_13_66_14 TaxID=1817816 RepID=A0A1F5F6A9_9BACT|nr:MAG: hypothetical protein A2Y64_09110 [Candidatus Coatesbacteria bacterium RBG_13_66_14]
MDCDRREINLGHCNCTYSCDKHGRCCECLHYHRERMELPACYFDAASERTWDRSISYFVARLFPRSKQGKPPA